MPFILLRKLNKIKLFGSFTKVLEQRFTGKNGYNCLLPYSQTAKKLLPTSSPDLDNVAKSVCDALNGVAYFDDSQICKLSIHKYYAKVPKIIVILGDWGDNLN